MMKKPSYIISIVVALIVATSAVAAERYKLRSPGGKTAAMVNEVGVWKSAKAANGAGASLGNPATAKNLECMARPGTKAELLKREGSVAYVRVGDSLFGGCKGYVKTAFLSAH